MRSVSGPLSGAREAEPSPLRRLVSRAMAGELSAFVVPGEEIARAHGLDLRAAGLAPASTPRHANVLLVVGELPEGLAEAAVVAYAQMPRPRAVLAVGSTEASLPVAPDASASLDQGSLESGVYGLRRRFAEGSFDPRAEGYKAAELGSRTEYACPMHPEVAGDESGTCPKCGMDLVAREAGAGSKGGKGGERYRAAHEHGAEESGESEEVEAGGEHGHADHADHGGHEGTGFMSMVEMTEGTPRGSDGLQMEWVRMPFGPLFPGLPGGLALAFTLDGDTVARMEAGSAAGNRESLEGAAASLADRVSRLDPLSPVSYRVLAYRVVEAAVGRRIADGTALARVAALERERAASHLSWLAGFGHVIGYAWLCKRAGELQLAVRKADGEGMTGLREEARRLARRVERTPLLRRRLAGVGEIAGPGGASGPLARAGGTRADARVGDGVYAALGFEPVVREGGDALERLRLRLAEIEQSLALAESAGSPGTREADLGVTPAEESSGSGCGEATVETPRGAAALSVTLDGGAVVSGGLRTPSEAHLRLVEEVSLQREVGDALVGVASLDLSPWGLAPEDAV